MFGGVIPIYTLHFRGFWRLEGIPSCIALGRMIICDLNFKRTENHNFTITTNTSQHVEFFHSLIFYFFVIQLVDIDEMTNSNSKILK